MPIAAVVMPVSSLSPRLVVRFGVRAVMVTGLVLLASGFVVIAQLSESSGYVPFLIGLLVFGTGMAMSSTPATTAIVNSLPPAKQGVASAMNDTTREVGSALGVALLGSMYTTSYADAVDNSLVGLPADAAHAATESAAAGLQVAGQVGGEAGAQLTHAVRVAFMDGLSTSLVIGAVVVVVGAALVAWIAPRRRDEVIGAEDLELMPALGAES